MVTRMGLDQRVDPGPRRWRILVLLAAAELLGMSLWLSASAVAPGLAAEWALTTAETGWLTTSVQLGFVVGTAVATLFNLADIVSARAYFSLSAGLGALVNGLLLTAPGFESALWLRFLTGVCLAGVYPPAMKMIATWFQSNRGLAIGVIVGALVIGKASPYLVRGLFGDGLGPVVLSTSAFALGAALMVWIGYRDGPHRFERRPFQWSLARVVLAHRPTRLAIFGYLGHMWELYAMWTWTPVFIAASLAKRGEPVPDWLGDLFAFGAIAVGGAGCLWGGLRADRVGRERLVTEAMAISGVCCLLVGFAFGGPAWLLALVTLVWGFFVVADSAQFSTLVTEVAPAHAVGTALTLQTSIGFLLTMVTIQWIGTLQGQVGWRFAFALLSVGPALGIGAIFLLAKQRRADG